MDAFRLCLALLPLSIYLAVLAYINLRRKPFLVTGVRDHAALGVALLGITFIGPVELLIPTDVMLNFRSYSWLLLLIMYGLTVSILTLLASPRMTVYNVTADSLRVTLNEIIENLHTDARWAGSSLSMPQLGIDLRLEVSPILRNVVLIANGELQSYRGWRQFEALLAERLKKVEVPPNPAGIVLAVAAGCMLFVIGLQLTTNSDAVTQGFHDMIRK